MPSEPSRLSGGRNVFLTLAPYTPANDMSDWDDNTSYVFVLLLTNLLNGTLQIANTPLDVKGLYFYEPHYPMEHPKRSSHLIWACLTNLIKHSSITMHPPLLPRDANTDAWNWRFNTLQIQDEKKAQVLDLLWTLPGFDTFLADLRVSIQNDEWGHPHHGFTFAE